MSKELARLIKANRVEIGGHTLLRGMLPQRIECKSCHKNYRVPKAVQGARESKQVLFELYIYGSFRETDCEDQNL